MSVQNPASSNIIKSPPDSPAAASSSGVLKRSIIEASEEAQRILSEARAEADAIRDTAESIARQARDAAYREGREEAFLELSRHVLDAASRRDSAMAEAERDLVRLAIKLAEKIVGRELETNDATIVDIVSTALAQARQSRRVAVRVNPADLSIIEKKARKFDRAWLESVVDFIADPGIARRGCVLETETGKIDAQLATQLRVLERAMLERAGGRRNP